MNVYQILDKSCIGQSIQARTSEEVLEQVAELMARSGRVPDKNALLKALLEREKLCSTAIGHGVAVPHAKCEGMTEMCVAVAITRDGVDFAAIDGKPVTIVFGLSGPPTDPEQHIRILSRIARIARNEGFREALIGAGSVDEVFKALVEEETRHAFEEEEKRAKEVVLREKKLMILVLYDEDLLDEVLEYLLEVGMGAGIVTEGTTLLDAVSRKVPLFADFAGIGARTRGYAKTITGIVQADMLNGIVGGLEEIIGDLDRSDRAALFALDVEHIKGSLRLS